LDKRSLGESVALALLQTDPVPLVGVERFTGAGIYALYYTGAYSPYAEISNRNRDGAADEPIYIGKAVPEGARKGGDLDAASGSVLSRRIVEHRKTIEQVPSLNVSDFTCRFLVVDDIWIPLGETLLIAKFMPLWNKLIDGFGNHDPGKGRHLGLRPRWDVLHPGRIWADRCQPRAETAEQIEREIVSYLRTKPSR